MNLIFLIVGGVIVLVLMVSVKFFRILFLIGLLGAVIYFVVVPGSFDRVVSFVNKSDRPYTPSRQSIPEHERSYSSNERNYSSSTENSEMREWRKSVVRESINAIRTHLPEPVDKGLKKAATKIFNAINK